MKTTLKALTISTLLLTSTVYADCPLRYTLEANGTTNIAAHVCVDSNVASFTGTYITTDKESKLPHLTDFTGSGGYNVNDSVIDGGFSIDNTSTLDNSDKVIIYKVYFNEALTRGSIVGVIIGEKIQFSGILLKE
jgi:hypothetical protein